MTYNSNFNVPFNYTKYPMSYFVLLYLVNLFLGQDITVF